MRLFYSPPSPYSAKVRLAAALCGVTLETTVVDTSANPPELLAANPLGKIPALMLDEGTTVYDSPVICEYLDRASGNLLIPQTSAGWLSARRMEALADGIADAAILCLYEVRYRPEEKRHAPWTDRQWARAERGLDVLEADPDLSEGDVHLGHLAAAAVFGWLDLRFPGKWDAGRPNLRRFLDGFAERFPPFAEYGPRAPS